MTRSSRSLAALLFITLATSALGQTVTTGFDEDFALSLDRAQVLENLIPGTPDHYYYRCLERQHAGRGGIERTCPFGLGFGPVDGRVRSGIDDDVRAQPPDQRNQGFRPGEVGRQRRRRIEVAADQVSERLECAPQLPSDLPVLAQQLAELLQHQAPGPLATMEV